MPIVEGELWLPCVTLQFLQYLEVLSPPAVTLQQYLDLLSPPAVTLQHYLDLLPLGSIQIAPASSDCRLRILLT